MATKNNRRILVTKRILKESLLELMKEKPISKISIKEICDLSEMSRSTFYIHYQDQFELLKDIEDEVLDKTFETLDGIDYSLDTIEYVEKFLNYVRSNKETFGVLLCQPGTEDFQNSIVSLVSQRVEASMPEVLNPKITRYYLSFVMHGTLNMIRAWIKNDFDIETSVLSSFIYNSCQGVTMALSGH